MAAYPSEVYPELVEGLPPNFTSGSAQAGLHFAMFTIFHQFKFCQNFEFSKTKS